MTHVVHVVHYLFIYLFINTGQAAQLICPGKKEKKFTTICMEVIIIVSYNDFNL